MDDCGGRRPVGEAWVTAMGLVLGGEGVFWMGGCTALVVMVGACAGTVCFIVTLVGVFAATGCCGDFGWTGCGVVAGCWELGAG